MSLVSNLVIIEPAASRKLPELRNLLAGELAIMRINVGDEKAVVHGKGACLLTRLDPPWLSMILELFYNSLGVYSLNCFIHYILDVFSHFFKHQLALHKFECLLLHNILKLLHGLISALTCSDLIGNFVVFFAHSFPIIKYCLHLSMLIDYNLE